MGLAITRGRKADLPNGGVSSIGRGAPLPSPAHHRAASYNAWRGKEGERHGADSVSRSRRGLVSITVASLYFSPYPPLIPFSSHTYTLHRPPFKPTPYLFRGARSSRAGTGRRSDSERAEALHRRLEAQVDHQLSVCADPLIPAHIAVPLSHLQLDRLPHQRSQVPQRGE